MRIKAYLLHIESEKIQADGAADPLMELKSKIQPRLPADKDPRAQDAGTGSKISQLPHVTRWHVVPNLILAPRSGEYPMAPLSPSVPTVQVAPWIMVSRSGGSAWRYWPVTRHHDRQDMNVRPWEGHTGGCSRTTVDIPDLREG